MKNKQLEQAIETLAEYFRNRNWKYLDVPVGSRDEKTFAWPAGEDEDIMVCVHKGREIHEMFHRQDFFFLNFAYKGDYGAISYKYDNHVTIREGECYIGQPFAGYALYGQSESDIIIFGVLIRKEAFYRTFLSVLSADAKMFRFFLEPQTQKYSEEFIRLKFEDEYAVRSVLELMVIEYASKREDTQDILRPMTMTLIMQAARQYKKEAKSEDERLSDKIIRYMGEHIRIVTLKDISRHFGYHPNYVSSIFREEQGRSFSETLLEQRMEKAAALIQNTELTVETVAEMLGYSNSSNFYKAFGGYFGCSPREFAERQKRSDLLEK